MSKLIKCKSCNAEIASTAKTCPSCGAKNKKPLYKKWWFWLIAVIIVAALFSGSENETPSVNTENETASVNTEKSSTKSAPQETVYSVGDVITTDKYEICVKSINTRTSVGGQYLSKTPADGGVYVTVDWEYKNITDKPISSFSLPQLHMLDKNNVKYDSDLDASVYYATEIKLDTKVLSDLNPQIKVTDAEVFEISKELYDGGGFSVMINADKEIKLKVN